MTLDNAPPDIIHSVAPTIARAPAPSMARERRPTVMIHPNDMAVLGLDDGDRVGVGHRRGDSVVHASRFAHMQRGVVIIESVCPNGAHEEGLGVNALGGAVYHDAAVWLRAA